QQMWHLREIGDAIASDQVFAKRQRHLRWRVDEFRRLNLFAQRDCLAMYVGNFYAHGGFSGDALDQNGLRLQSQAKILGETCNPAVLDASLRLELVCCDHGAWINLRDASADIELLALLLDGARAILQVVLIDFLTALRRPKQLR